MAASTESMDEAGVAQKYDAPVKKEYLLPVEDTGSKEAPESAPKKAQGKREGGQNKHRSAKNRVRKGQLADKLCVRLSMGEDCPNGDSCKFSHDVEGYLAQREPDLGPSCHLYETFGKCKYGLRCRYAGGHQKETAAEVADEPKLLNDSGRDIQIRLRKKQILFPRTTEID
ncbi:tRNA-dihydrouridine synthase 3, partial [Coemansia sp. RSA 2399]